MNLTVPSPDEGLSKDVGPEHLAIIINNSIQPNRITEEKENYKIDILIKLFETLKFTKHEFHNINAYNENLSNILNSYQGKSFGSRWLVFIGSAIEYGPVSEDNRVFNVEKLLDPWKDDPDPKFLVVFGSPHENPSTVQHDAKMPGGPETFEQLSFDEYADLREEIKKLQRKLGGDQFVGKLDKKLNYFLTSVPPSIINRDETTILDVFANKVELSAKSHETLSLTLNSTVYMGCQKQLGLAEELLPVYAVPNDFSL